ncbi:Demethylmenaquinone methyltransferase [Handroanthus impetiginosus]|uniref:Demethylmenaquinone methyltransferase n=1 Tax=Handroanthus impetiginosus TaxID=429701 RepID=A0A2G9GLE5_9LAMI|nr:Demethylmenaquinone methyltransferase [Handroanthus impetiginosus]
MATAAQPSLRFHQNSAFFPRNPRLFRKSQLRPPPGFSPARIRASSALALDPGPSIKSQETSNADLFACPICYELLIRKGPSGFNLPAIYRSGFKCRKCNKSYSSKNIYLDLTVTSGTKEYNEFQPAGTELFRSPLVSFVYERGWRQNFNSRGFPGPVEEFNMAQEYFKPAEGGVLVDVSCGSGLFSRKFAKSEAYSRVVALDFSENMLRQCYDFIKSDETILSSNLALVRADVSRLPFSSGSIDAVHAGAALHCWPSPSNAVAEINRILRSGGIFVGTTFLRVSSSTPALLRPFRQRITRDYNYLTEEEIEDLCTSCGLVNYTKKVQQSFIMFSAQKP